MTKWALALIIFCIPAVAVDFRVPKVVKALPRTAHKALETEQQCLGSALHHEASGEPLAGQRAVYDVITNRAKAAGKSICAVVRSPGQFSWVGSKPMLPYTQAMKEKISRVKNHTKILDSKFRWFFTTRVQPKWSNSMDCHTIGNHKFCAIKESKDGNY